MIKHKILVRLELNLESVCCFSNTFNVFIFQVLKGLKILVKITVKYTLIVCLIVVLRSLSTIFNI